VSAVGSGGAPGVGLAAGHDLEHIAWTMTCETPDKYGDPSHLGGSFTSEMARGLRAYHRLREYAYEKEGLAIRLPTGLVYHLGKFRGGEPINLMLVLPYIEGLLSERQTRSHLKVEVGRRMDWCRAGGMKSIGDPAATKWRRRREITRFHQRHAQHHGWSFPVITCSIDRLITGVVDSAVADWTNAQDYLGRDQLRQHLCAVARSQGQFVETRGDQLLGPLYPRYLRLLAEQVKACGLSSRPLQRSLRMLGNTRKLAGTHAEIRHRPRGGRRVPGSGAGTDKGDLEVGRFLIEMKLVRSGRCRVRASDLRKIDQESERIDKVPVLVLDLVHRRQEQLIAVLSEDDSVREVPWATDPRASAGQKSLRLSFDAWRRLAKEPGHWIMLSVEGHERRYRVVAVHDVEAETLDAMLSSGTEEKVNGA